MGTKSQSGVTLPDGAIAAVNVPASFSEQAQIGLRAYDAVCAACHGLNAQGKEGIAPPIGPQDLRTKSPWGYGLGDCSAKRRSRASLEIRQHARGQSCNAS